MKTKVSFKRGGGRTSASRPIVSVIVPAKDESRTIGSVVRSAKSILPGTEVIAVVNGKSEETAMKALLAGAKVIRYKDALGHDVGRSIGAKMAKGKVLLFLDADFVIPAAKLRSYVAAVRKGHDVVLNGYSGFSDSKRIHSTSVAKRFLNHLLGRGNLLGSSMTAVPHALSKRAAKIVGFKELAVPPKAQAKAVIKGLSIARAAEIRVSRLNRKRTGRVGKLSVERLILGDHAEALQVLSEAKGHRAGLTDLDRNRALLEHYSAAPPLPEAADRSGTLSVIIAARNEEHTIREVLDEAGELDPDEIIVVVNGSTDRTAHIAEKYGAKVVRFAKPLGYDVGRAVGAMESGGEVLLFLDGDIAIEARKLRPFVRACQGGADIALNDVNRFYKSVKMIDSVSMAKEFLNRMLGADRLGFASMTAVPHAVRREAVQRIGYRHLAVPPLFHSMAVVEGLKVELADGVNVLRTNRRRATNVKRNNAVAQLILGDHAEALQWLQKTIGPRVYFKDEIRRRELIT
ncbi:glycosyltransferase family 2 protein [Paenibacillus thermotolerans]|uniref:glycosyltransferase family 2 protein n=1 Tax=Paenibacillus thermotolerans TaxID=3027807 RepID=UPI002367A7E9|nr:MULTISPECIES: glycosyltransferase family 2 protein [unclassified Paenibacillus]